MTTCKQHTALLSLLLQPLNFEIHPIISVMTMHMDSVILDPGMWTGIWTKTWTLLIFVCMVSFTEIFFGNLNQYTLIEQSTMHTYTLMSQICVLDANTTSLAKLYMNT